MTSEITPDGDRQPLIGGLPAERLQLIGRIAVAHSFLEFSALLVFSNLVSRDDDRGIAIAGGDTLRYHLDRIRRLVRGPRFDLPDELRARIEDWVERVGHVKDERNAILHSMPIPSEKEGIDIRVRTTSGTVKWEERSVDDLPALAETLEQLLGEGFGIVDALRRDASGPIFIDPDDLQSDERA